MILHLGSNVAIFTKVIIAIFDIDTVKFPKWEDAVVRVGDDPPRSLIYTDYDGKRKVYLSPISSGTLRKRCEKFFIQ